MLGKTKNPGGQSAPQKNKYLVIALLCLPFVLCLYLIFGGSGEQAPATVGGLNFNIPDGRTQNIEGNKQKAMEREQMNEQHDARVRTLAESTFSLSGDTVQAPKREQAQPDQIAQSRNTYRDLTREMNSFYATPRTDPQIAALKKQVAELSAELEQSREKPDPLDYMDAATPLRPSIWAASRRRNRNRAQPPRSRKTARHERTARWKTPCRGCRSLLAIRRSWRNTASPVITDSTPPSGRVSRRTAMRSARLSTPIRS